MVALSYQATPHKTIENDIRKYKKLEALNNRFWNPKVGKKRQLLKRPRWTRFIERKKSTGRETKLMSVKPKNKLKARPGIFPVKGTGKRYLMTSVRTCQI